MGFVKFEQKPGAVNNIYARSRVPLVTVYANKRIYFNTAALLAFPELVTRGHVVLYYDRESNRIGMEVVDAGTPGAYKLSKCGTHNRKFSPLLFFEDVGLRVYDMYRAPLSSEGDLLVFDGPTKPQ